MVVAVAMIVGVPALRYAGHSMDEGLLLVYPELILKGAVPNRDFVTSYGPGGFWLLAGAYAVVGPDVAVERILGLAYHVAIALALFAHAYRWGPLLALASGLMASVLLVPLEATAYAWLGCVAALLWSIYLLSSPAAARRRVAFAAGLLAGTAVLFRPELGAAALLSALPSLVRSRAAWSAAATGFAVPLVVLGAHVLVAGPAAVMADLVLAVFKWGPGRYLPLPGFEPPLFVLLAAADGALLVAAAVAVRAEASPRSRALLAAAILSGLTFSQALQRADLFHLASAGVIPLALLPVTLAVLLDPRGRPDRASWRHMVPVVAAVTLVAACAPGPLARAILVEAPRGIGLAAYPAFVVAHEGRSWYPLVDRADAAYAPIGSAEIVAELTDTLAELDRVAAPGARLFVGPRDLRRTVATDTFIYHLAPRLVPATSYLEMAPGTTNAPDSHLAADVASADVLVLTDRYDDPREPNASVAYGPDAPNAVVRERFMLRATHGSYGVYTRRASAAIPRDAIPFR